MLTSIFGMPKVIIGMVHLLPLPGSPRWAGDLAAVLARAREDALALARGGVHGLIVENFGDLPFERGRAEPHTVAAMTLAVRAIRDVTDLPVGVNVLRNDAISALAIAHITGAQFIRVNVLTGAVIAGEGIVEGEPAMVMRYRRRLGAEVKVFADVLVKHAAPVATLPIEREASDAVERGLADAVIVTGPATGEAADMEEIARARAALPKAPLLVGSGVDDSNVKQALSLADGVIVGTSLKRDGVVTNPVDEERVRALVQLAGLS